MQEKGHGQQSKSLGQRVQMTIGKVGECSDSVSNFAAEKGLPGSLIG